MLSARTIGSLPERSINECEEAIGYSVTDAEGLKEGIGFVPINEGIGCVPMMDRRVSSNEVKMETI